MGELIGTANIPFIIGKCNDNVTDLNGEKSEKSGRKPIEIGFSVDHLFKARNVWKSNACDEFYHILPLY